MSDSVKSLFKKSALSIALAAIAAPVLAAPVLEEILVTAQKRTESLQDVPISVAVMSGEKISEMSIRRFEEVAAYIPNVTIQQDVVGDMINIRGIQSGPQAGFEQSVATFIDGVYRGRGVQSRYAFLDVAGVEVLRGPQSTLFGKNTVAGALNVRSNKPTEEFEGSFRAGYNVDFDETELRGHVSGGLSDTLRGRVAFISRDMDEGWVNNTFYDEDSPDTDEWATRLSLDWDLSDATLVSFKYEHGEWDNSGQPYEIIKAGSLVAFGVEGEIDGKSNMGDGAFSVFPDDGVQDIGSLQTFEGELDEFAVTVEHTMDSGATITAIGSYSSYDFERFLDADFNPLTVVRFDDTEDFEQTSLELRIASNTGGAFEYIAGVYYQDNELFADSLTYINIPTLGALVAGGCAAGGGTSIAGDVLGTVFANAALGTTAGTASACFNQSVADPMLAAGLPGVMRYALLDQDTETLAVFGQVDWAISDSLRATLGLRYTEEDKTARQAVVPTDYGRRSTTVTTDPLSIAASTLFTEFTPHDFRDLKRDESSFTWSANVQWDLSESVMTYVSASTGFKAGGFNSFYMGQAAGAGANPDDADFEEEEVIAGELGAKMTLLDGAAELNIALFWNQYEDLQASVFSGQTTVEVRNAAEATSQGIEIDGRWQATDKLMLSGALGWIDFEFDSFPNQACTSDQFIAFREVAWDGGNNPFGAFANNGDCAQAGVNDMKGRTSANTAELSFTLSASYTRDIGDYRLGAVADVIYNDDMYRQDDLDPTLKADSYTTLNALLRFGPSNGVWELAVIGKNLTDVDENFNYGTDVPLFDGSIYAAVIAPRNITVVATLNF